MQKVRLGLSISLDGYVAGPSQSEEAPLGVGGEGLHEWAWATRSMRSLHGMEGGEVGVDDSWAARHQENVGATRTGERLFDDLPEIGRSYEAVSSTGGERAMHVLLRLRASSSGAEDRG